MASRSSVVSLILLACIALTFGCAAKGPKFEPTGQAPENKSIVYIYRPSGFVGGGVFYDVYAGQDKVCTLVQGGYCQYFASPGELEVWAKTESKSSVTLDVKPAQVYYVKGDVSMGLLVGRPYLSTVDTNIGSKEIVDTSLCIEK